MRKIITILLLLTAVFLSLFSCGGSFLDPNVNHMRDGGFGPNSKGQGSLLTFSGDITITPNSGVKIGEELTAIYNGSEKVTYQWKKDGVIVSENSNKFTPTEAGSYTVTVIAAGYKPKTSAVVDVNDPSLSILSGTITIIPDTGITAGTELTAVYSGNENVNYQWKKDGINIDVGGNSNKYTPTEAGNYTVTVSAAGYNPKTSQAVTVIAEYPFLVSNEEELRKVGTGIDGWTLSAHYRQIASFTMTGGNFTPIGNSSTRFSGSYNGDGYTITGLTVTGATSNLGLFGYIGATGTVKNMDVTGTVTNNGTDRECVGGIAGYNEGTIDNCSFSGTVNGGIGNIGNDQIGGIVGENSGTVINSRSTATVSGRTSIGGIVGANNGNIENSYNMGAVNGSRQIGGIAGYSAGSGAYIKNCYNTGNITATSRLVGGIAGYNEESALIEYCYNIGNISGSSVVGGIAGINISSTVKDCVSLGVRVTGIISMDLSRVVGSNEGDGIMTGNKARADMKIGAGGAEAVPATNTGATAINGESVTIGSSTTQSSVFNGWDFSIWTLNGGLMISETSDLPTLKTNTQSPAPKLPAEYIVPNGSAEYPFLVSNEAELRKVGTGTDGWTLSAYYRQIASFTMTGGNFPPIGNNSTKFSGSYNGDGFTITGLSISGSTNYLGLFGYVDTTGMVKNMDVTGTVTQSVNFNSVGGIAGYNAGTIDNCSFSGTISGNSGGTSGYVGGIIGSNFQGTVINCRNNANVTGRNFVGGIAGTNYGKIENSYNTGSVTGTQQVGGISGDNTFNDAYIKNCYNTGNIAASSSNAGGIVGLNQSGALVEYCYNTGNVSGSPRGGGIAGSNDNDATTTVRNCVSLGIKVTGATNVGRVAGITSGTLNNKARADMKIGASGAEVTVTGGTATDKDGADVTVSTAQSAVFSGWDSSIWNISGNLNNSTLPTLKPNPQSPAPTLPVEKTLIGNITISPSSGVTTGTLLTANYTGSESVSYQWKKDGVNVGGNSSTFTPTEAGSYTVTVSAIGYTSKTSTAVTVTAGVSVPAGMVYVSPGTFQRGKNLGSGGGSDQTPLHQVTLTRGFYMARYEVTQEQYVAVMGTNPSNFQTAVAGESGTPGKLPVERVSWFHALVFCNKLSINEGLNPVYSLNGNTDPSDWGAVPTSTGGWSAMVMDMSKNGYRLPTEAEWEYAAKGGDQSVAGWVGYTFAGSDTVDDVAWYNSNTTTHEVGKKSPNALGLYDMSGNVFEWCWDRYAVYTSDEKIDPTGPSTGNYRIVRGGSVRDSTSTNMRSVYRNYENPQTATAAVSYGFRLVRSSQE